MRAQKLSLLRVSLFTFGVLLMLAAGCSGDDPTPTATAPSSSPTGNPTTEPTEEPSGEITRSDTLISRGWGAGTQITNPEDFNPFSNLYQRDRQHYTINESLFYTNFNNGEVIPWLAESYQWNGDDFTSLTIKLRDGVMWSDGERLTADDVVFTIEMLQDSGPELLMSGVMIEWIESAVAVNELTVDLTLNKPGPRFFLDNLAQGQVGRFVVVPEHIWAGQDSRTFTFYDTAQGWPVSTGPYEVTSVSDQQIIYKLRDSWWAVDAGLVDSMPEVRRIVYVNTQGNDALANLYVTNDLDVGGALPVGVFEAIQAQNRDLMTWSDQGPVYGAPDGCTFRLNPNNQREFFDNADVRWALNHAINRDQIVDIAYEGSQQKALVPFSSYGGVQAYLDPLQDLINTYNIDDTDLDKVDSLMTGVGFTKGSDGFWDKPDGSDWELTIYMGDGNPIGPVIVEQLRDAGFDAKFEVLLGTAFNDTLTLGDYDLILFVHCGSIYDPWQTLDHFHSKYTPAVGERLPFIRATSRYANPELDAVLDQMEAVSPSVTDQDYLDLVREALTIYLEDMPEITIAEEFHVVMFNEHYWTGWPTVDDPYIAPYIPWEGFNLVIHRLQKTGN